MKYWIFCVALLISNQLAAQEVRFKYYTPQQDPAFVIEGQAWPEETADFFDRLPARAEKIVRKPVWNLSKQSAGLQIRFMSDAPDIVVRYTVRGGLQMPHMPATGVSGVDLYAKDAAGRWLWAAAKYAFKDTIVYRYSNLSPERREYVLYLPLYNSVKWMEIGVPEGKEFTPLPVSNRKPVVVYGTSIAQGGCASRPGLGWTNILSRRIDAPVINLAFSGNGRLEPELIGLISEIDARVYVLDCLPNLTGPYVHDGELRKRLVNSVMELKARHPFTPVLLTAHDGFTDEDINPVSKEGYSAANRVLDAVFDSLTDAGVSRLYILKKEAIGQDIESTVDGVHPNDIGMMHYADAYEKILKKIFEENKDETLHTPSLIPLPQKVAWKDAFFNLEKCGQIRWNDALLKKEASYLENQLNVSGFRIVAANDKSTDGMAIDLILDKYFDKAEKERYRLTVDKANISIRAGSAHGIFNGIQTFMQLIGQDHKVAACEIEDAPAFTWRGYMIDVGRNYMPIDLLKQQIEVMARYKLNVFHFHATEDIAWRFEIKKYPQLTAAGTMTRNPGKYYTREEIQELIRYCKERYITFVPEIDMPGHSAAFTRAMGVDMQSREGMKILKDILKEICTVYDVPYIHIGADEVKITNPQFVPEMTRFIERYGKQVIGWQPGGNFTANTIRQLWMDDNAHLAERNEFRFIDSRHLYLNHIDPLEAVVTLFNREIGDVSKGSASMLGATLCMWNDRRVAEGEDILRMNPVFPGMLAFSERVWRGGGQKQWISNVSDGDIAGFKEFESRILDHKKRYFSTMPFPYVKQGGMRWMLIGPYENQGNLAMSFSPETQEDKSLWRVNKEVLGGTVVLRHWWAPLIKGAVDSPAAQTTFYAYTKLWSESGGRQDFWIGFNDISRSPATDAPPVGEWNDKHAAIWVNGNRIDPPQWKHGGEKGNSEVPLTDEGYSYRPATVISLKKGWNEVLVKCPIGSFRGKDWQNPAKWMFTFVETEGNH